MTGPCRGRRRGRSTPLARPWADSVFDYERFVDAIYGDELAQARAAQVVLALAAAGRTHRAIRETGAGRVMGMLARRAAGLP